jgi:hypothetical protein
VWQKFIDVSGKCTASIFRDDKYSTTLLGQCTIPLQAIYLPKGFVLLLLPFITTAPWYTPASSKSSHSSLVILLSHSPALYFPNVALIPLLTAISSLGSFLGPYPNQVFQEQFTMLSVSLA